LPTVMILEVGFMNAQVQHPALRIDHEVSLATFDFFPAIIATKPPFCLVLTD
jgi:hypothetical protein